MLDNERVIAKKSDWKTSEMPELNVQYTITRKLSDADYENLKYGSIPQEMEDRWFWYFEDNKLYAFRSWSGFCIYILSFTPGSDRIEVVANRDPKQYACTDEAEDANTLNELLDWWIRPQKSAQHSESEMCVQLGDITTLGTDCIVNAANKSLLGGGGVDGAIHRAAGAELLKECKTLHGCHTGEAKITKGYRLKAPWIIHTVGPIYSGKPSDATQLADCYRNTLELARTHHIKSIAFPSISTGVYGYPLKEAVPIAVQTVAAWLKENAAYSMEVVFCCFDQKTYDAYQKVLAGGK